MNTDLLGNLFKTLTPAITRTGLLKAIIYFGKTIVALGVLAWFSFLGLQLQYYSTRPLSEQASAGRPYALNTHGRLVYLTRHEMWNLHALEGAAIVLLLVALAAGLIAKKYEGTK